MGPSASAPRQLLAILWPSAPLGMSLGPPYARALAIPSYFSRGGVPKDRGVAPRRFRHFWFYAVKKKKKTARPAARPFEFAVSTRRVAATSQWRWTCPRDGRGPPAGLGGHQGHEWDPVGQAMRKTCALQCCRGSLYRAFSIGLGAAAVSARRRRRGEFPPSDRPIAHRCSH